MARVRVEAAIPTNTEASVPRVFYTAQIFEDDNDTEPVWTCIHEHGTTVAAQLCGVQFITDRVLGHRRREIT